jgi:hypothetical protein
LGKYFRCSHQHHTGGAGVGANGACAIFGVKFIKGNFGLIFLKQRFWSKFPNKNWAKFFGEKIRSKKNNQLFGASYLKQCFK